MLCRRPLALIGIAKTIGRAIAVNRSADRCRRSVVNGLRCNRGTVVLIEILRFTHPGVLSESGTTTQSKGSSGKNKLLHFNLLIKRSDVSIRRSHASEMGDSGEKFQSRKCCVDHSFVRVR
jgi:hypothetical protein